MQPSFLLLFKQKSLYPFVYNPTMFHKIFKHDLYSTMHAKLFQLCLTLCDPVDQGPLSMGFSRQEYWSGLP